MEIAPLWVIENQWYDLSYLESRGISVDSLRQLTEGQTPIALLRRQNGSTDVQFRFVGIIANNSSVLYCVPKYTDKLPEIPDAELIDSFKATLSATLRATHTRLKSIGSQDFYRNDSSQTDHWLTTARALIYDFIRAGSYYSRVTTIGNDPYDEACWDETIASSLAMYKAGRPFYPEPFTHNQQLTCNSVIARLHHSILQDALDRLHGYDPLNALNIPRPVIPASIPITSLGSVTSLLHIIESESRRQFEDRKRKFSDSCQTISASYLPLLGPNVISPLEQPLFTSCGRQYAPGISETSLKKVSTEFHRLFGIITLHSRTAHTRKCRISAMVHLFPISHFDIRIAYT